MCVDLRYKYSYPSRHPWSTVAERSWLVGHIKEASWQTYFWIQISYQGVNLLDCVLGKEPKISDINNIRQTEEFEFLHQLVLFERKWGLHIGLFILLVLLVNAMTEIDLKQTYIYKIPIHTPTWPWYIVSIAISIIDLTIFHCSHLTLSN